jgi:hypothetical protein
MGRGAAEEQGACLPLLGRAAAPTGIMQCRRMHILSKEEEG